VDNNRKKTKIDILNRKYLVGSLYDDGYWYYLRTATNTPTTEPQGSMLISTTCTIGGTSYQFDGHGHCLNP
jgi:hypothetical protein